MSPEQTLAATQDLLNELLRQRDTLTARIADCESTIALLEPAVTTRKSPASARDKAPASE